MRSDLLTPELEATKAALDKVSPTLCLAKWLQTTLHLQNGFTHSCHHVIPHRIPVASLGERPEALHNTDRKRDARAEMLTGQRPKECAYCWKSEELGRVSDRILKSSDPWARPRLEEVVRSGTGASIQPSYLEVAFDSVCNFRCMYCGPAQSSSWHEEIKRFGAYPTSRFYNNLWQLNFEQKLPASTEDRQAYAQAFWHWWPTLVKKLEHFRITGGEPLLSTDSFRALEWLRDHPQPNLNVSLNTNLSITGSRWQRLLTLVNDLHGRIQDFRLFVSIDSVGAQAEYIRYGLDEKVFFANAEHFLSAIKMPVGFSYMITINALSLPGLRPLLETIRTQRLKFPRHDIRFDTPYLKHPEHLGVGILTTDFVSYLDDAVAFMRQSKGEFHELEVIKLDRIREQILRPELTHWRRRRLRRDFGKMVNECDRRRSLNFKDTFPEYHEFLTLCQA